MNLSYTSMSCFKTCPMQHYLRYGLGLVPIVDEDARRIGTNWHRIQEINSMEPGGPCECMEVAGPIEQPPSESCPLCQGTGIFPDNPMDAVIRHLNEQYKECPIGKDLDEWETERVILLYSLSGYNWWYNDDGYEVERLEQKFNIPLRSPITGHALKANLIGKIDRIFSAGANRFVHEYKSTSRALDSDSTYWSHLTLDAQTHLYAYAANALGLGLCGVLYDVWHKPQIRPKKLTQADSKQLVQDGQYCGEQFKVTCGGFDNVIWLVNGKQAVVEPGAKEGTFAIRETPEMFGARLLQDIGQNPGKYFARRELARNAEDLKAFEWELFNIYQSIKMMSNKGVWWRNEFSCEATYKCDYINLCYNHISVDGDTVPDGFRKVGT